MQLSLSPETTKSKLLTSKPADSDNECIPVSQVTIEPKATDPWYVMDSEKYEVTPAKVTLLKDKIRVFTSP